MLGLKLNHVSKRGHRYEMFSWVLHVTCINSLTKYPCSPTFHRPSHDPVWLDVAHWYIWSSNLSCCHVWQIITSRPEQNGCHSANNIYKCISMKEMFCIFNLNSLKFLPKGLIDNKSSLFQVTSWCRGAIIGYLIPTCLGNNELPDPYMFGQQWVTWSLHVWATMSYLIPTCSGNNELPDPYMFGQQWVTWSLHVRATMSYLIPTCSGNN